MRKTRYSEAYEMTRVIYPVGLGTFCIERFYRRKDQAVVFDMMYDCGSLSGYGDKIQHELQGLYAYKPIDLVCISHFDEDHINVFRNLLNTPIIQSGITTILMPQIIGDELLEQVGVEMYVNYRELRQNLSREGFTVIDVLPMGDEAERIEEYSTDFEELNAPISSGARITLSRFDGIWEYIPFNNFSIRQNADLKQALLDETNFSEQKMRDIHNGHNIDEQDIQTLKDAYGKLKQAHSPKNVSFINCNSLQILSKATYPVHSGAYIQYHLTWDSDNVSPICCAINSSCMYTGDSVMDHKMINIQQRYLGAENLGLFQIPHHGSKHCYDQRIIDHLNFQAAFVNTDLGNKKLSIAPEVIDWQHHNIPAMFIALKGTGGIVEHIY